MPELTAMRNIGGEMARKPRAVGLDSPEALREAGAGDAFFRLKTRYSNVCPVHLYALEGAGEETLKLLLDMSFRQTAPKPRRPKGGPAS